MPALEQEGIEPGVVRCQVCGAGNTDGLEYCGRCQHKLLVISGPWSEEIQAAFDSNPEEQLSFDEHLLERISVLEQVVRRTTDTVRQLLGTLHKLEQKNLVNQTGIVSLRDLLEAKRVISREEWSELWESRLDDQLLALEKRERFLASKRRMVAQYRGEDCDGFQRLLDEAEVALLALDMERATDALERAHQLDARNHELSFFLGEVCFNEGASQRALGFFEQVLDVRPEHYESLVYAGVLRHEAGDAEAAERCLNRAVVLMPAAFLPSFSLGAVYASQGRLAEAVKHLELAVAIEPVPRALYLLGSCFYEMGRTTTAIRHLEEAVRQDPAFEDALHLLGLVLLDRRWYRRALDAFRRAQMLNPKKLPHDELLKLIPNREAEEASSEEASSEDTAGMATRWAVRARGVLSTGQTHQALAYYRRALAHEPENPEFLVAYALVCLDLDRAHEIRPVVDKIIGLEPGDRLKATAYTTLIEALRTEGKYHEGNRVGRLLLAEGNSAYARTLAYYEMAFNHAELDEDLDEALSFARSSLEASPDELLRLPLAALGWVHYKRSEFAQAVDCLIRSNELGPSVRTLTHLGMALLATGDREQARAALASARRLDAELGFGDEVVECLKDSVRLLQERPGATRG